MQSNLYLLKSEKPENWQ